MNRTFVAAALCLAFPAPLDAQAVAEKTPDEICARLANFAPGPKARPTEEDRKLVGSGSLGHTVLLQYGDEAKEEREYDETRRYCLVKGDCDIDLAMIFANGWGVARDYDAATWFLCRLDASTALAEKEGMLAHVERMRTAEKAEDLLYCDHATSTMGLLYCPQPSTGEESPEDRIAKVRETLGPEAARAAGWACHSPGRVRERGRRGSGLRESRGHRVSGVRGRGPDSGPDGAGVRRRAPGELARPRLHAGRAEGGRRGAEQVVPARGGRAVGMHLVLGSGRERARVPARRATGLDPVQGRVGGLLPGPVEGEGETGSAEAGESPAR